MKTANLNMRTFLLVFAALAFSAGGLSMKASEGLTRLWPSLGVFAAFSAGAAFQTLAMRDAGMGNTYVLVLGLEAVTAFALGAIFLDERVTAGRVAALALIVGGIALLGRQP